MSAIAANVASPAFGFVVLAAAGISFQVLLHGFRFPGMTRGKVFGKAFHESNAKSPVYQQLLEEHKKATGEDKLPQGG